MKSYRYITLSFNLLHRLNKTKPAAKKGEVDVMLSILSKSPPCPGKREPLFFNPTFLLKTLIVRSPSIDNTVIAKQNGIKINKSISPSSNCSYRIRLSLVFVDPVSIETLISWSFK